MPDPISKAQEEEMSTALIAQLLAEDAYYQGGLDYYGEYDNPTEERDDSYEENSEDEFDPRKKAQIQKEAMKRGNKRKTHKESMTNEKPLQSKKPRRPVPEGFNTGVYSDLEEKSFLEGLELFGRDWTKLQVHVATRDANSIRSHAQKHFIKMFRDNIPLPPKVKESGDGYTLSGRPLDPNSSAAKPYLKSMDKKSDKLTSVEGLNITENPTTLPCENNPKKQPDKVEIINHPFQITVQSSVLLTIDFHAHLMTTQIAGFLMGEWDKEAKRIVVREACPCQSSQTDKGIQLNPSETKEKSNLKIVGWYCSLGSDSKWIEDQYPNVLLKDHSDNPRVAAVVSPYTVSGSTRWFYVDDPNQTKQPVNCIVDKDGKISEQQFERMFGLLKECKELPQKVSFNEESKLKEMIQCLTCHMPQEKINEHDDFLHKVKENLQNW